MSLSKSELYAKAISFLAKREYSKVELAQKLEKYSNTELVNDVIDQLIADNLQSDVRYVEVFIRSYARKYTGPTKIRYLLSQKGVASSLINNAMDAACIDWQQLASEWLEKHFANKDLNDFSVKSKAKRALYQRGFSPEFI